MPGVSIRLIAADGTNGEGATWIGLEIDMPETTRTYWRVPGESGIPPQFDFSGSTGVGDHEIAWPYPTRGETEAYLDHAYFGHTVLPISIAVTDEAPVIALDAMLGICADVCVPVSASFSLAIDPAETDRPNMVRIGQARAEVPIAWNGPEMIGEVRYDAEAGALLAALGGEGFPASTAIADIAGRMLLFGPPEHDAENALLRFPLLGRPQEMGEGETVHITFTGPDGPYEIVRPLRLAGAPCAETSTLC